MLIKPFTFERLPLTVQLINSIARDAKSPMTTFETEQRMLAKLPGRNFETDRFLAFEADQLIAYADVWRSPHTAAADITIGVHSNKRRQGIGTQLFEKLRTRASELEASSLLAFADPLHIAAAPFLQSLGFSHISAYRNLRHEALDTLPRLEPQPHTLRSYTTAGSPQLLKTLLHKGYADLPGHKIPLDEHINHILNQYDSEGIIFLCDAAGKAVGCVLAQLTEDDAHLSAPAILPTQRSAQTYRLLCLTGLEYLYKQGATAAHLDSWGDAPSTIRVYQNLGFRFVKEVPMYRLELS